MKVEFKITVDIDADSWVLNYGIDKDLVRSDVKGYLENIVLSQLDLIDVLEKEN